MFVYGDVVIFKIGRYWPWKTVTVSSHLHMPVRPSLLHRMALVSFLRFFRQLARIFWANGLPPPMAKKLPVRLCLYQLSPNTEHDPLFAIFLAVHYPFLFNSEVNLFLPLKTVCDQSSHVAGINGFTSPYVAQVTHTMRDCWTLNFIRECMKINKVCSKSHSVKKKGNKNFTPWVYVVCFTICWLLESFRSCLSSFRFWVVLTIICIAQHILFIFVHSLIKFKVQETSIESRLPVVDEARFSFFFTLATIVQFYRWIQTLTIHWYRVSLDVN